MSFHYPASWLSEADLAERLQIKQKGGGNVTKDPPAPSGSARESLLKEDLISSHPDLKQMVEDQHAEAGGVALRVVLKPQKDRAAIAALLHKGPEDKKPTQKCQIVIKDLICFDAMAILKLLGAQLIDGRIKVDELKEARDELLTKLRDGGPEGLVEAFKKYVSGNIKENQPFFQLCQRRIELSKEKDQEAGGGVVLILLFVGTCSHHH